MAKQRQKGKAGKTRSPAATSQRGLAAAHGVSLAAVQKWIRDARWTEAGFRIGPPWSAAEIERQQAWRESLQEDRAVDAHPRGGGGSDEPEALEGQKLGKAKSVAQIRVLVERAANLRVDRLIKEKQYVPRDEVEQEFAQKVRAVRMALQQLPAALRQMLGDADADGCQAVLEEALRRVMEAFYHE